MQFLVLSGITTWMTFINSSLSLDLHTYVEGLQFHLSLVILSRTLKSLR